LVDDLFVFGDYRKDEDSSKEEVNNAVNIILFPDYEKLKIEVSAFLQLFALIVFSVFLVQKGASHSRNPNFRGIRKNEEKTFKSLPFPQNVLRLLYENSLSLVLLFFFLVSFILHIYFGLKAYNEELQLRSQLPVTLKHYLSSNRFWFENLSTWQAEFMAIFGFIVASIYFRQRGSAESKPVDASDDETGIHE
jgi:hypothetical protein